MRTYQPNPGLLSVVTLVTALLSAATLERSLAESPGTTPTAPSPIPMDQIGAVAGKQYSGDGLTVEASDGGALLRCVFQRLDGEATTEGLWLTSTVSDQAKDRFRVKAVAIGNQSLPERGEVSVEGGMVRFSRPGLVEEYSVSMDGVQQDFLVLAKPRSSGRESAPSKTGEGKSEPTYVGGYKSEGELRVNLAVSGARVEQTASGAQLVLGKSGRKIAYSRLKVTDANGRELPARIKVASNSTPRTSHSEFVMAVVVNDVNAVYPLRIDPTFSDANWISLGGIPGANGIVVGTAVVDDAGNLYVGGDFTIVGDVFASRIAKWNGSNWSALGIGMAGDVYALAVSGTNLYAGGDFTLAGGVTANRIAKWNGSSWSALGSGMNSAVYALTVSSGDLYAGGDFTTAGGITVNRIARWNGSSWSAVGLGMNSHVQDLKVSGSDLYAGGGFTMATNNGGVAVTVNRIAKWDGSSWGALGGGVNSIVYALALSGADVYAGGEFTRATNSGGGSISVNRIASWNGSTWTGLGSGMNGTVNGLAVSDTNIYASGVFTAAGGASANRIARFNGTSWSALGAGLDSNAGEIALSGNVLYVVGVFTAAGGKVANQIAKWNGSSWSALASGMNNSVSALAVVGSNVYAGGSFTTAGGVSANRVAKWNGNFWSPLGSGMNDNVATLAVSGTNVYAGGSFTTAGGSAANYVARWNGSTWSPLGTGMNGAVSELAVSGNEVYAGGFFKTAGGNSANYVAKWDGISWSALGSGMNNWVTALAVSGTNVYAGGGFTTAGDIVATNVAKWDGNNWSAMGLGINGFVNALVVSGNIVYAGGQFTQADGLTAANIAKWSGGAWSSVGVGMNGSVNALAVSGNDLYACGTFTQAGFNAVNRLAKWDGSSWSALGSGLNDWSYALALSDDSLYAGGDFTTAGGKVSGYVARAVLGDPPGYNQVTASLLPGGDIRFAYVGYPTTNYTLERSHNLSPPVSWVPLKTNTMSSSGVLLFTNAPVPDTNNFWRIRTAP